MKIINENWFIEKETFESIEFFESDRVTDSCFLKCDFINVTNFFYDDGVLLVENYSTPTKPLKYIEGMNMFSNGNAFSAGFWKIKYKE